MTELSLFSNQTPTAAEPVGAPRATEVDAATPAAGPGGTIGECGRGEPTSRPLADQPETPTPPTTSPTPESGRGGLSSAQLLGLLDALVVGLDGLGGGRLEECLRLLGRCEARLAAVKAEKIAELAQWRGEAHAAAVLRGDLKQSRGGAAGRFEAVPRRCCGAI